MYLLGKETIATYIEIYGSMTLIPKINNRQASGHSVLLKSNAQKHTGYGKLKLGVLHYLTVSFSENLVESITYLTIEQAPAPLSTG